MSGSKSPIVKKIMQDYARLTGLAPADAHPRRYLWTDAFAVCWRSRRTILHHYPSQYTPWGQELQDTPAPLRQKQSGTT